MHAIKATWTNGQIVPAEPVDWPEGSQLQVQPLLARDKIDVGEKIGLDESEWEDTPEALADWNAWLPTIEPMIWEEGEREEYERFREEVRKYTMDAVRKQMEEMADDGA